MFVKPRDFFDLRAKAMIKELREYKHVSYKELARRLEAYGVLMTDQVLINRINRGSYTFAFALMVLDALGAESIEIPKHSKMQRPKAAPRPPCQYDLRHLPPVQLQSRR